MSRHSRRRHNQIPLQLPLQVLDLLLQLADDALVVQQLVHPRRRVNALGALRELQRADRLVLRLTRPRGSHAEGRRRRDARDNGGAGVAVQRGLQNARQLRVAVGHVAVLRLAGQRGDHARQPRQRQVDLPRLVQRLSRGAREANRLGARQVHQRQLPDEHAARVRHAGERLVAETALANDLEDGVRARRLLIHVGHAHVAILLADAEQLGD